MGGVLGGGGGGVEVRGGGAGGFTSSRRAQEQSTTQSPWLRSMSLSAGETISVACGVRTIPGKKACTGSVRICPNLASRRPVHRLASHCPKSHMARRTWRAGEVSHGTHIMPEFVLPFRPLPRPRPPPRPLPPLLPPRPLAMGQEREKRPIGSCIVHSTR